MQKNTFNAEKHKYKNPCPCSGNAISRSKGETTIVVVRDSFNIPRDLPYVIWGNQYLQGNSFAVALKDYLPPGVTVTTVQSGEILIFRYTFGALVDEILVLSPPNTTINYFETLSNLTTNFLRSELVYLNFNAEQNPAILTTTQINTLKSQVVYMNKSGSLGSKDYETIIPGTRTQVNNSVPNIVELAFPNRPIKADTAWVHTVPYLLLGAAGKILVFYWQVIISDIINVNEENKKVYSENANKES